MAIDPSDLTRVLAATAQAVDRAGRWSPAILDPLRDAGAWRWAIPPEFGGDALAAREQVEAYEAVARGSMTAALILTQHDGACQLIADGDSRDLKHHVLPQCARGELLATVGISHLTTSRRHTGHAMRVVADDDAYRLQGVMPWVTSAPHCDLIVTGGVLDDGRQILAAIPPDRDGVTVGPVMELVALQSSATCEVRCANVRVERRDLIRGPVENALARRSPVKSLTVSATGLGHAGALLDALHDLPAASRFVEPLADEYNAVRSRVLAAADARSDPEADVAAAELRAAVNALVMRLAIACGTLSKGTGMLLDHPAQRLFREAMFFLVWSAPQDVQTRTLAAFAPPTGPS